jgi:hypothetical protein
MAQHNNYGALGGLSRDDYNTITQGLQSKNNSISTPLGNITPTNVMTSAIGLVASPLSAPMAIGSLIGDYNLNKASNTALGRNTDFMNNINRTSINDIRGQVDVNKDGRVDTREAQNWGMNKGLTSYNVGLNPMAGYTPNTVSIQGLSQFGKSTPTTGTVNSYEARSKGVDQFGFSNNQNRYSSREAANISQGTQTGIGRGVDTVGLGGAKGVGYSGSTGNAFGFGKAEGVGDAGPTGLGGTSQTGSQVSHSGKGISFSDDAASSSSSGGTYICTALYEMGDMKKSIYKYDQIYGKKVDPATYRGYELWGKYVASKLRNRGIVYKVAKPIALTWANQMAYDLSKGKIGKNSLAIKITKTIGEGCCYILGQIFKRRTLWLKST